MRSIPRLLLTAQRVLCIIAPLNLMQGSTVAICPSETKQELLEAEVLIPEARARQRRRWTLGSILLACVVVAACGLYAASGSPPVAVSALGAGALPPYFPGSKADQTDVVRSAPDLLFPSAIAVEPNGDLLIADTGRDQIMQRTRSGRLSIFAGTGESGFAGDGRSAPEAEFHRLGDIVESNTGTVYVADTGNCRIRAISDGRIRTLTTGLCDLLDLAISPASVLYASNGHAIYRIAADGAATPIPISSPHPLPGDGGSAAKFDPCRLAFTSGGDLIVASGYYLVRLSPSGVMTPIGHLPSDCGLDGMATEPDGNVLITEPHGDEIQQVTATGVGRYRTVAASEIAGFVPSDAKLGVATWDVNNIVESSADTIYAEATEDAGYFPGEVTQLVQIPSAGRPSVLPITTPLTSTLPTLGSRGFPASLYPASIASRGSGLKACPNPRGIEPFNATAKRALAGMIRILSGYSFFSHLRESDPSWWTGVFDAWSVINLPLPNSIGFESVRPAVTASLAPMIAADCGESLVQQSLVVSTGELPKLQRTNNPDLYVLDRDGHPLLYLEAT